MFPYTDVALTRTSTRSDREPEPGNVRVEVVQERLVENGALAVLGAVTGRLPRAIPRMNRTLIKGMTPVGKVDRSHSVYATRRDVRFTEMEYAIPREHGPEALRRVLGPSSGARLPIAFPIEMRVVRGDDAPLSTAHGRDSVYIAVHQFRGQEFETYFRAVEAIMDAYGGRPHWGKRHYQSAATLRDPLPGVGRLAGGARPARPRPRLRQRLHAPGAGRLEEGLALAAVGRHLVDHRPPLTSSSESKRSHSSPAFAWRR